MQDGEMMTSGDNLRPRPKLSTVYLTPPASGHMPLLAPPARASQSQGPYAPARAATARERPGQRLGGFSSLALSTPHSPGTRVARRSCVEPRRTHLDHNSYKDMAQKS